MVESVSLYFHIPFCTKKCPYCHFYVVPDKDLFKDLLQVSLGIEWQLQLPLLLGKKIVSIYFGGGTPTLFAPQGIGYILKTIRESGFCITQDCEITIEANPEESSSELFETLLSLQINRLSLGVQSLDDRWLAVLERGHAANKAKEAVLQAYAAGFTNISIDLMYDLPDQTEASWLYTLDQVSSLPITHLSLYNLTIEPHTSFYKRRSALMLPNPETSLKLLQTGIERLEKMGLERYEISAFAKKGCQSRHNTGYWTGRPFLGFGPSAFSYWEGERFRNVANLQRYVRALKQGHSPVDFREKLLYPANFKELLTVHLRLLGGAALPPSLPQETRAALDKWTAHGCLIQEKNTVRLTERGALFYDEIASDIV